MKTNRIITMLAVAAAAMACNQAEIESPSALKANQFMASAPSTKVSMNADYSLYWEAGDQVSVFAPDGSNNLFTSEAETGAKTTVLNGADSFTIDLSQTYYAIYPYSADNSIENGVITTTIPTVQTPVKGAFPVNHAVAVSDRQNLSFLNVCGLFGFNITQEDIVSVTIKAKGAQEYLTGKVAVDCADASYTVVDGLTEVTLVTKDKFAVGTYYVAVLPQTFSGVTVTMFKADGSVASVTNTAGFRLDRSHRLETGVIDGGTFAGKITTITNAGELQGFLAAADSYSAEDVVTVANDIDLSGYELVPATSFAGTFDGQSNKITNWNTKTALFNAVSGTVKDLTIDQTCSLEVQIKGNAAFIALANSGTISDCVNNGIVTSVSESFTSTEARMVGTIAAVSTGKITSCTNNGAMTLNPKSVNKAANQYVGGLVGKAYGSSATDEFISECTNNGALQFTPESFSCKLFIGGVCGGTLATDVSGSFTDYGLIKSSNNYAPILLTSDVLSRMQTYINLGGVVGYAEADLEDCDNEGAVVVDLPVNPTSAETNFERPAIGGVAGSVLFNVTNCDNSGDMNVTGAFGTGSASEWEGIGYFRRAYFGGVVAIAGSGSSSQVKNCTNDAELRFNLDMFNTESTYAHVGGIVGNAVADVSLCTNSGLIDIQNKLKFGYVGGIAGLLGYNSDNRNSLSECTNNADITCDAVISEANGNQGDQLCVGGIVGDMRYFKSGVNLTACTNAGSLTIRKGKPEGVCYVGGIAGYNGKNKIYGTTEQNIISSGNISVDSRMKSYVGGVAGQTSNQLYNVKVNMDEISVYNPGANSMIGGICGYRTAGGAGDAKMYMEQNLTISVTCNEDNGTHLGLWNGGRSGSDKAFHTTYYKGNVVYENVTFGVLVGYLAADAVINVGSSGNVNIANVKVGGIDLPTIASDKFNETLFGTIEQGAVITVNSEKLKQ